MSRPLTVKVYRGNRLPHPDRHATTLPPLGRDLGKVRPIAACELCGWAQAYADVESAMEDRRTHLMTAHGPDLQSGRATIHLTRDIRSLR